jgi:hypothetical protein
MRKEVRDRMGSASTCTFPESNREMICICRGASRNHGHGTTMICPGIRRDQTWRRWRVGGKRIRRRIGHRRDIHQGGRSVLSLLKDPTIGRNMGKERDILKKMNISGDKIASGWGVITSVTLLSTRISHK